MASQFGDGLFQAGLAGALLFNPDRAADPWAIAGAFAVLFLPYSLLGPFAGALLDRWDRRSGADRRQHRATVPRAGCRHAAGGSERATCRSCSGALIVNGFTRFVSSGLSAALPHVVPRDQVVTMNSVATATGAAAAFLGANFMLVPRWLFGAGDTGAAAIIFIVAVPVSIASAAVAAVPSACTRAATTACARSTGRSVYAVATGWLHGARTVLAVPTVAATLAGLAAHRMVFGINTLLVLVMVRHSDIQSVAGLGTAVLFFAATGIGAFLANVLTPGAVGRWGRYAHRQRSAAAGGGHPAGRRRPAAAGDGGVRVPARRGRPGGQALRRQRDADRRRRRAARPRVRGAGRAVLGVVHRRDHRGGGGRFPPTATHPRSCCAGRWSIWPGWRCTPASAGDAQAPRLR